MRPRRFLPSNAQLLALEAVLRSGSTTGAAEALDLTQSTVSRLIASLEDQLGTPLFLREKRRLRPTEAALRYGQDITRALDLIQGATTRLVVNPGGGALSLAVLPTFATRWLAPRIDGFLAANPGIALNFATRIGRFDFAAEHVDAVIYFGQPDWPEVAHQKLFDETMIACAAPAFLDRHEVRTPGDLAALPLLHLESRMGAWAQWFEAMEAGSPRTSGMVMDQFSLMIQAAIQGLGVALLPEYLAREEIALGRLAPVKGPRAATGFGAYWLAWPEDREAHAPLIALREWLGALDPAAPPRGG